jgi:pimeloyl-ACP methyl ester carboxylesterase
MPGFGESVNAPGADPHQQAKTLAVWADALAIRDAVWVGHSIGCNVVAHLAAMRPDLCREAAHIGPLWTKRRYPLVRLFAMLVLDAIREPLQLYRFVIPSYWRTGIWRWCTSLWKSRKDLHADPGAGMILAGRRDPLPDRTAIRTSPVDGAHACHFSDPQATAEALMRLRPTPSTGTASTTDS